jgi:hypothetical protein
MHNGRRQRVTTEKKSKRGGYRPGAGRKAMPGDLQRRDARIEAELIDLAVLAGQGEFSAGVRFLLRLAQRVHRHDASKELPPVGTSVLALCDYGWHTAKLTDAGAWVLALELVAPQITLPGVTVWCNLPPTPEEVPIVGLTG